MISKLWIKHNPFSDCKYVSEHAGCANRYFYNTGPNLAVLSWPGHACTKVARPTLKRTMWKCFIRARKVVLVCTAVLEGRCALCECTDVHLCFHLFLQPVPEELQSGPGFGYVVAFRPQGAQGWMQAAVTSPDASRYIFKNESIAPFSPFHVKVGVYNNKGEGPFGPVATIYSAEEGTVHCQTLLFI